MNKRAGLIIMAVGIAAVLLAVLLPRVLAGRPPEITALQAAFQRVFPSGSTEIVCSVSSPDGVELNYEWQATGGLIEGEGAVVVWTAPAVEGFFHIEVTVSDQRGNADTKQIRITSKANVPPMIASLTADAGWTLPAGSLRITCEAEDPDGDELSYVWTVTDGSISGTGAAVTWTAPADVGKYYITVVVSDGHGGSDTETLRVSVETGQPPVIEGLEVTTDRYGHCYLIKESSLRYKVGRQQMYDIECLAHHPDHLELSYEWECEDGEIEGEGSMIIWTAPNASMYVTITVTVSDGTGRTASESVTLNVVGCSPCTFRGCP
ncbi:MAG: Ig-like domain-containing protein [Dehalococcoidia bacterium]